MPEPKLYTCKACGLKYREKKFADACYAWCSVHKSCNIGIIKNAVK